MRRLFTIFTIFSIYQTAFGQQDIGVKLNGGLSYLSAKIHQTGTPITTQTFYFIPSGQGGFFYNLHLGDKSLLGTELLFVQIEGKEHESTPATDSYGNPTGQFITGDISRHISYLSVPIYYGYNFKKLSVNIGLQTSFMLASSGQTKSKAPDGNGGFLNFTLNSDKLPIKNYDLGIRAELSFTLTNKFSIEATYYCGLLNIYKYSSADWTWKAQQITIGLRYKIFQLAPDTPF